MKWTLLFPGRVKPTCIQPAIDEYARRLVGCNVLLYKDEKGDMRPPDEIKSKEGERILKLIRKDDFLIACDENGRAISTEKMAEWVKRSREGSGKMAGKNRVVVVVGGALGLAPEVLDRANTVWSLSKLVMAGSIARLVLLEALYRANTILDGHPYHNA